ncbi:hypothetical protein Syun_015590 [Stephania yunnanensis]|uniref:Uncharacterized protein n=1 Tax=Stephania yunnanensis TaxID=152371 RepID=A0AAP0JNP6_9MAGN
MVASEMVGSTKRQSAKSTVPVDSGKEDLCFVCLDGRDAGEMVGCGRRDCAKAYHLDCVNQDERILSNAGCWTCGSRVHRQSGVSGGGSDMLGYPKKKGWHVCTECDKTAKYMCYTCVYSLCTECIKDFDFFPVRRSKGFCDHCIKYVMLIEDDKPRDKVEKSGADFDDEFSWHSHFKDYWIDLKNKLSITLNELKQAKNLLDNKDFASKYVSSDCPIEDIETMNFRRSNTERRFEYAPQDGSAEVPQVTDNGGRSALNCTNWASKEFLELVGYMKNGDTSFLSRLDARAVLLEYIARNKLRDPDEKSQVVCDSRLRKLFGKTHVKHFEMLRLFDSHLLIKEDNQAEVNTRTRGDQEMQEVQHNSLITDRRCDAPKLDDKSLEKLTILRDAGSSTKKRKHTNPTRKHVTVNNNFCEAQKGPIAANGESEHVAGKDGLGNGCRIDSSGKMCGYSPNQGSNSNSNSSQKLKNCTVALASDAEALARNIQASVRITESAEVSPSTDLVQTSQDETNTKMWYYQDPKGKTQGPFSMQQLDKWSRSSQFPANLKIWKTVENREVSILLIDALNDKIFFGWSFFSVLSGYNWELSSYFLALPKQKISHSQQNRSGGLIEEKISIRVRILFLLTNTREEPAATTVVYGLTVDAKYSYSSAFKYFVAANAGASLLSLLGLICIFLPLQGRHKHLSVFLLDLLVMMGAVSGCSAAAAFGWVGKYGNTHTGWMAICDKFSAFCNRSQNSVGIAVVAALLFLISMIGSVIKLSKEC